jgi:hypothetical protein
MHLNRATRSHAHRPSRNSNRGHAIVLMGQPDSDDGSWATPVTAPSHYDVEPATARCVVPSGYALMMAMPAIPNISRAKRAAMTNNG